MYILTPQVGQSRASEYYATSVISLNKQRRGHNNSPKTITILLFLFITKNELVQENFKASVIVFSSPKLQRRNNARARLVHALYVHAVVI